MKKICVATSTVPFTLGGNELLAETLVRQLRLAGHKAHLLYVPQNRFGMQCSAYIAALLTDVRFDGCQESVDQVISLKFPSFAVRHPVHVSWLNHRMREYYDLWDRFSAGLRSGKQLAKEKVRRTLLRAVDTYILKKKVSKVYAQSKNVQQRLQRFGNIPSEVLYPPATDLVNCKEYEFGDFILSPGRLVPLKRHDLLIKALAQLKASALHAVIAGVGEQESELKALAESLGIAKRVRFVGALDYKALSKYYSKCLAVFFGPYNEDCGLVTLEANKCHKPVITCIDSGGPTEIVSEGTTGRVVEPDEAAVAQAIDELANDEALARSLGEAAFEASQKYNWQDTIERLLTV